MSVAMERFSVLDSRTTALAERLLRLAVNGLPKMYREETDEAGRQFYAGVAEADRGVVEAVGRVAAARGVPRAQVALAWLLQQPGITSPIIGASRDGHLEDAVAALSLRLTPEECAELEGPYVPHPVAGAL